MPQITYKYPKEIELNNVQINKVQNAEIGDKLIEKGKMLVNDAIKLDDVPNVKKYYEFNIKNGDIIPIYMIYDGYKLYKKDVGLQQGIAVSIKYGYAYPYRSTGIDAVELIMDKEKIKFSETISEVKCEKCFKHQFIFNGKVNNSLKFTYREFIDDMARPAFTQDLQYDLSESNIIGFKGLRLEVIDANNTNIQYKVINNFTP